MRLNSSERHAAQAPALRERHRYSMFDVGRSMFSLFDVEQSYLKRMQYYI